MDFNENTLFLLGLGVFGIAYAITIFTTSPSTPIQLVLGVSAAVFGIAALFLLF